MKISDAQRTTFEELKFPAIIYKYRQAQNNIHRTIITEQTVYFSPPKTFEDKLDCKIPVHYDLLTDAEIFDQYLKTLREENPLWDSLYLRDQAIKWCNLGLMRDQKRLELIDEKYYNELNERYGVLSLTTEPKNIKMWKKYSDNFNGFCIGFDPIIMFKVLGGGGLVNYSKKLPVIKPTDSIDFKITVNTFSKLNKWSFEKEYRTHIFWPHSIGDLERKVVIPKEAYYEIILGHNINIKTTEEIIDQAQDVNPDIKIWVTKLVSKQVVLEPYT